jgi:hypothetical protein
MLFRFWQNLKYIYKTVLVIYTTMEGGDLQAQILCHIDVHYTDIFRAYYFVQPLAVRV